MEIETPQYNFIAPENVGIADPDPVLDRGPPGPLASLKPRRPHPGLVDAGKRAKFRYPISRRTTSPDTAPTALDRQCVVDSRKAAGDRVGWAGEERLVADGKAIGQ
jgi:hypothetical protein